MSESISIHWILKYWLELAEKHGAHLQNAPISDKKRKIQITQFITCPRPGYPNDAIWARVSDKQYEVPIKLTTAAVADYNSKYNVVNSEHPRRLTARRFAVACIGRLKPFFARVPLAPGKGMSAAEHLVLEVGSIDVIGGDHSGLFGPPQDIEQHDEVRDWVAGLKEGGGAGNVLKNSKEQLKQENTLVSRNHPTETPPQEQLPELVKAPTLEDSAITVDAPGKDCKDCPSPCKVAKHIGEEGRAPLKEPEKVDLLKAWKKKWKLAERIWPCLIDVPDEIQIQHNQVLTFGKGVKGRGPPAVENLDVTDSANTSDEGEALRSPVSIHPAVTTEATKIQEVVEESDDSLTSIVVSKIKSAEVGENTPRQSTPSEWMDSDRDSQDEEEDVEAEVLSQSVQRGDQVINSTEADEGEVKDEKSVNPDIENINEDEDGMEGEDANKNEGSRALVIGDEDSGDDLSDNEVIGADGPQIKPQEVEHVKDKGHDETWLHEPTPAQRHKKDKEALAQNPAGVSRRTCSGEKASTNAEVDTAFSLDNDVSITLGTSQPSSQYVSGGKDQPPTWRHPLAPMSPRFLAKRARQANEECPPRILVPDSDTSGPILSQSQSQSQSLSQSHIRLPQSQSQSQPQASSVPEQSQRSDDRSPSHSRSRLHPSSASRPEERQGQEQKDSQTSSVTQEDSQEVHNVDSTLDEQMNRKSIQTQTHAEPETLASMDADDAETHAILHGNSTDSHSPPDVASKHRGSTVDTNENGGKSKLMVSRPAESVVKQTSSATPLRKRAHETSPRPYCGVPPALPDNPQDRKPAGPVRKKMRLSPPVDDSEVSEQLVRHDSRAWQEPSFIQRRKDRTRNPDIVTPLPPRLGGFTVDLTLHREADGPQWLTWNDVKQVLLNTGRKRHRERMREKEELNK